MSKSLMIIGTASGVGKSTVSLGIGRALFEDGLSVAPFKTQNISDNAHLCADGRQMARSQAIAAFACGLEPEPDMNPVLLKTRGGGLEVVLGGVRAGGEYDAAMKARALECAMEAYRRLAGRFEVIVIEGAGSPVELNIRAGDIANMRTAVLTGSPVILVADISAGGVFAAVYGTLELLAREERALVKGIVVNKFTGEPGTFSGIKSAMEEITGLPLLGILPYFKLGIEDEDSLADAGTGAKPKQSRSEMEREFAALAGVIRENLDMALIKKIIYNEQ